MRNRPKVVHIDAIIIVDDDSRGIEDEDGEVRNGAVGKGIKVEGMGIWEGDVTGY